ncbi:50S ribosome-binding GTPase [Candidatus Micrarchaeota archaeon]|nr:50S ribosome-binding GTPase [Candidatus Micrarchaeota archaeon]
MIIGIVGAPNKGKSTFFSAATMVDAQIADYPFTTIDPNKGTAYARSECPHVVLGLQKCDARNSKCRHRRSYRWWMRAQGRICGDGGWKMRMCAKRQGCCAKKLIFG